MVTKTSKRIEVVPALPPDHYRVAVTGEWRLNFGELRKKWGKDGISGGLLRDAFMTELHDSCGDVTFAPGERVFWLYSRGKYTASSKDLIRWGLGWRSKVAPNGYRPATANEGCELADARPELGDYVAYGSFFDDLSPNLTGSCTRHYGDAYADNRLALAVYQDGDKRRRLGSLAFSNQLGGRNGSMRALFVAR